MDPPEALRVELACGRALGFPFEACWAQCVVRAAFTSNAPGDWLAILCGQREAWERAFARMPGTSPEQALESVRSGRRGERDYALEARRCAWCDRPIPTDVDERARYCPSRPCKRQANYELERRRAQGPTGATGIAPL